MESDDMYTEEEVTSLMNPAIVHQTVHDFQESFRVVCLKLDTIQKEQQETREVLSTILEALSGRSRQCPSPETPSRLFQQSEELVGPNVRQHELVRFMMAQENRQIKHIIYKISETTRSDLNRAKTIQGYVRILLIDMVPENILKNCNLTGKIGSQTNTNRSENDNHREQLSPQAYETIKYAVRKRFNIQNENGKLIEVQEASIRQTVRTVLQKKRRRTAVNVDINTGSTPDMVESSLQPEVTALTAATEIEEVNTAVPESAVSYILGPVATSPIVLTIPVDGNSISGVSSVTELMPASCGEDTEDTVVSKDSINPSQLLSNPKSRSQQNIPAQYLGRVSKRNKPYRRKN